jgi:hypothetical protein
MEQGAPERLHAPHSVARRYPRHWSGGYPFCGYEKYRIGIGINAAEMNTLTKTQHEVFPHKNMGRGFLLCFCV